MVSIVAYHSYVLVISAGWGGADEPVVRFLSLGIARWALPFLGCLSGYLFFRHAQPTAKWFLAKYRRRGRSLLLPYLIWSVLGVAYFGLTVLLSGERDAAADLVDYARAWPWRAPFMPQLWFLQGLMGCVIISPLVYIGVRRSRGWLLVVAVAWWLIGWPAPAVFPWLTPTVFLPFCTGATIALLGRRMVRPGAGVIAVVTVLWVGTCIAYTSLDLDRGVWSRAGLLVVASLGIVAVWCLADVVARGASRWPRSRAIALWLAPFAFFVYLTQAPLLTIISWHVLRPLPVVSSPGMLHYVLLLTLDVAVAVAVGALLRSRLPRIYSVLTGGRKLLSTGGSASPEPLPIPDVPAEVWSHHRVGTEAREP